MKKKVVILTFIIFIVFGISLFFYVNKNNDTQVYENKKEEVKEQIVGSNWLSMMYETGPGTGEYSESKSSLWPESGYIFNETLSGCENGGELSWNEDLGAVNLKTNTSEKCYVYFDMYIIPVINSVKTSDIETNSITLTVNVTNGNNPVITYYYSNNNGSSYVSSNSNTYTFNGLDMGTEYSFSVYVEDNAGYKSDVYTLSETTDDVLLLADWVISQYGGAQGNNGIYYHTSSLANSAEDNSYRYSGANPNNYVCFGTDEATCLSDNLYRIIGVFGSEVKLIKNTSIGGYAWDEDSVDFENLGSVNNDYQVVPLVDWQPGEDNGSNDWSTADLNYYLNNNIYLDNIDDIWQNKIANHSWKVGGMIDTNGYSSNAQTAYNYEVGVNSNSTTYRAKIGLMYLSDYYYAATSTYWIYPGYSSNESRYNYSVATSYNWMYMGLTAEWTISRRSDNSNSVFFVDDNGSVFTGSVVGAFLVRPCFYLNSDVTYVSGSGTESDPIRINGSKSFSGKNLE